MILFCNIAYMQYYDAYTVKETPQHGGSYVSDMGDAFEKHNFHVCEDGIVRGFVETKYHDGSGLAQRPRKLRLEQIDPSFKNCDFANGITVVFCAYSDTLKTTVIVGWYHDATVLRGREKFNGNQYNLFCWAENAYLLKEGFRTEKVPRASIDGIGLGQSNQWYANKPEAAEYVRHVLEYMDKSETGSPSAFINRQQAEPAGKVISYYKLVRDLIPDIIAASGKTCVTEMLSDEDYLRMVDAKLDEELAEYHREPCLEELADLVEVIYAAAKARGYSLEELERVRAAKAAERGAFERKILLKEVTEK